MTVLHTLSRTALVGTALGLTLAGCAASPAADVAHQNRMAAARVSQLSQPQGVQYASLENTEVMTDAAGPVVRKGTVLWRRVGDEPAPKAPEPQVSEELKRLREAVERMQGLTTGQIAALQQKLATNEQALQQVSAEQARQEQDLRQQNTATSSVARLAEESVRSMRQAAETNLQSSNQHLTRLESSLQSQLSEVKTRQQASEEMQSARMAAVSTQVAANQKLTEVQLAQLRKVSDENRALASSETANVAVALRIYADRQLAQAQATTSATLAEMAAATNQSLNALDNRTSQRMGVMWTAASRQAEKLAEEKAGAVAASVAALQQQTAAQKIEPAQIRAIAEQTMADSTPEFRALALQTLKDGQDYIRSVARSAVQDKDPGMTSALADAARDVITRDDKVVFAIRKAVADELQSIATGSTTEPATGARTTLGPDHTLSEAEQLDPNRLRIAQLLAPEGGPASDAAKLTDAQLAAISPAAGQASSGAVVGQHSWSAQGTSLMRARNRADWMDIRQYKVVVHQDDQTLETLLGNILKHAEPFTGPWQIRWKISDTNKDLMTEKFSLDAEAPFEEFVSYLAQYIVNDRGVKLSVSLFDSERIIVISD